MSQDQKTIIVERLLAQGHISAAEAAILLRDYFPAQNESTGKPRPGPSLLLD